LSGFRAIAWFGIVNLAAVAVIATVQAEGLTSVWCLWAAVVSVLIYASSPGGAAPVTAGSD
jgi:hypothetical protein